MFKSTLNLPTIVFGKQKEKQVLLSVNNNLVSRKAVSLTFDEMIENGLRSEKDLSGGYVLPEKLMLTDINLLRYLLIELNTFLPTGRHC